MGKIRGKYKPKDENVKKLIAFIEKERTQNLSKDGSRRIKDTQ